MLRLIDAIRQRGSKAFQDEDVSLHTYKMPVLVVDEVVTQIDNGIPFTADARWDYKRDFRCLKSPGLHAFVEGKSELTGVRLGFHLSTDGSMNVAGQQYIPSPEAKTLTFLRLYTEINYRDKEPDLGIVPSVGFLYLDDAGQWVEKQLPVIATRPAPEPIRREWAEMIVHALPMLFVGLDRWWDQERWEHHEVKPIVGLSRRNRKKYGFELASYTLLKPAPGTVVPVFPVPSTEGNNEPTL